MSETKNATDTNTASERAQLYLDEFLKTLDEEEIEIYKTECEAFGKECKIADFDFVRHAFEIPITGQNWTDAWVDHIMRLRKRGRYQIDGYDGSKESNIRWARDLSQAMLMGKHVTPFVRGILVLRTNATTGAAMTQLVDSREAASKARVFVVGTGTEQVDVQIPTGVENALVYVKGGSREP